MHDAQIFVDDNTVIVMSSDTSALRSTIEQQATIKAKHTMIITTALSSRSAALFLQANTRRVQC